MYYEWGWSEEAKVKGVRDPFVALLDGPVTSGISQIPIEASCFHCLIIGKHRVIKCSPGWKKILRYHKGKAIDLLCYVSC